MQKIKLTKGDFFSIFLRTFFLQAVWNFKSLVSVGLSFAMVPVARRLGNTETEQADILKRHLFFFNAHPFFASFALGALARLEEDRVNGKITDARQIDKFKNALIGPLGAVGDLYFWATIRPAAILVGLGGVVFFKNLSLQLTSIGFMLVLYNIPHFHIRLMGLKKGYINGYNIYKCLKIEKFITVKSAYQFTGALVLGVIMALLILEPGLKDFRHILIFITAIVATGFLRHKGKMMQLSVLLPLIFAIILGIL